MSNYLQSHRNILTRKCIDMPNVTDDYYSRILSWCRVKNLFVATGSKVACVDITENNVSDVYTNEEKDIISFISEIGQFFVMSSCQDTCIIDPETGACCERYREQSNDELEVMFSSADRKIESCGNTGRVLDQDDLLRSLLCDDQKDEEEIIFISDSKYGEEEEEEEEDAYVRIVGPDVPLQLITSMEVSNKLLLVGRYDGYISLRDLRCPGVQYLSNDYEGNLTKVVGLAQNFDQYQFAAGSIDGDLTIWDLRKNQKVSQFDHNKGSLKCIGWCPWEHQKLYTGGGTQDNMIRKYDLSTNKLINQVDACCQIRSLRFANDTVIVSPGYNMDEDYKLQLWKSDLSIATCKPVPTNHCNIVIDHCISPDPSMGCSISADETVRFQVLS